MKLKITIKGKVHGVGYRVKLINIALEYGIDRFSVFNVEMNGKQAVVCLVDAPDNIIEILKQRVKSEKPEKAIVESIEFEEYRYEVPPIERCMQAFQMEHWGKAIPILLEMRDSIREESEKTRVELRKVIREEGEKTRVELGKIIREESEKMRVELGGKIDLLRLDLREFLESNLREIHSKISEIEKALKKAGIM